MNDLLRQVNDGILITEAHPLDKPGPRIVYVNRAFERISGYRREEVIGQSPRFLQGPETDRQALDRIRAALREGRPVREEIINYHRSGKPYWVEIDITPVYDEKGNLTHFAAIEREITERKQKQASHALHQRQFASAFTFAPIGMAMVDLEGCFMRVNSAFCQMLGYPMGELLKLRVQDITEPEDWQRDLLQTNQLLQRKSTYYQMEKRYRHRDGHDVWTLLSVTLLFNENNEPDHYIDQILDISPQKKAEEERLRALERLTEAQKVGRIGDWEWDLLSGEINWSPMVFTLTDRDPGLGPPQNYEDNARLFDAQGQLNMKTAIEKVLEKGIPQEYELTVQRRDGTTLDTLARAFPRKNAEGKIIGMYGTLQDIDERKKDEARLASINRSLRLLTRCNEILIHARDEPAMMTEICRSAIKEGGFFHACVLVPDETTPSSLTITATAVAAESPAPHFPDPDKNLARQIIDKKKPLHWQSSRTDESRQKQESDLYLLLQHEETVFGVILLTWTTHRIVSAEDLSLLTKLANNIAFGLSALRERQRRQNAEREIARQAALLDKARDAIMVHDIGLRIQFWNKGAERLYGWTAEEAIGQKLPALLGQDSAEFLEACEKTINRGQWDGEFTHTRKDGRPLIVEGHWTRVQDSPDTPASILAIHTDITEKKEWESQFLRTQRLESIGTLAGGIAHDLNNVLAPITMSIELLKSMIQEDKAHTILEMIENSAQRGAAMIRQVLSFARGLDGKRVEIDLFQVLRDIRTIVKDTFPKNITYEEQIDSGFGLILADPTQVHQILLNLCVNARDAMPSGGTLRISLDQINLSEIQAKRFSDARPGTYRRITVKDTGCGMNHEVLDKLFDPFFTTKPLGQGTGLGLSTSLAIMRSHGGFIDVRSTPGKGSAFTLHFPAIEASSPAVESPHLSSQPRGNGKTVLVVEDEDVVREIARHTLENYGYKVLLASNGEEGLQVFEENLNSVDVILTDIMMPVMDGPEMIYRLRRKHPRCRVIAASGISTQPRIQDIRSTGPVTFLAKPFSTEMLLKALHEVLHEGQTEPANKK